MPRRSPRRSIDRSGRHPTTEPRSSTADDRHHHRVRDRRSSRSFHLRSRSPAHHRGIVLTPKQTTAPPPKSPTRPSQTVTHDHSTSNPPLDATTNRQPTGSTDDSDNDDTKDVQFAESDAWVREYRDAANDPNRPKLPSEAHESPPQLLTTTNRELRAQHKQFIDIMFSCLEQPYTTKNGSKLYIRADRATIHNIATCFLRANMLDLDLARQTKGWFIETPNLLTVTVPTGFDLRPPFHKDDSSTYLCYHKTDWQTIPYILVYKIIRPASWTKDKDGNPSSYPSYGFFGYTSSLHGMDLHHEAVSVCTRNLNKIGKAVFPSGVLTVSRCPTQERFGAGGNDALQRLCRYAGCARGKEGYSAVHSAYASVQFVVRTTNLNPSDLTWLQIVEADKPWAKGDMKTAA